MTYDFNAFHIDPRIANGIFFVFTWETINDAHVCPKCNALSGVTWETLELTPVLTHPVFGDVYDLETDQSLVHPNCRCYLHINVQVDLEKIPAVANLSEEIDGVMRVMPSDIKEAIANVADLEKKVLMVDLTTRQLLRVLNRAIILLERAGLDKNVSQQLQEAQRLIMLMRQLMMSMAFLQIGTPYGFAMGILGLGLAATTGMESQAR